MSTPIGTDSHLRRWNGLLGFDFPMSGEYSKKSSVGSEKKMAVPVECECVGKKPTIMVASNWESK